MRLIQKIFILIFIIIFFQSGCSSPQPKGKTDAEVLYHEAERLVDKGNYLLGTEKLNLIKSKYPYSYYAVPAELLLADILFKQEDYVEAAAAYTLFRDFHPKHKRISYVVWRIAESYYEQRPSSFDRDLEPAQNAIQFYKELLRLYPHSEYAKDADKKINVCQEMIEKKEKYIADFYFRTDAYAAARYRYLNILNGFDNKKLREHAMVRIVESSMMLYDKKKCEEYYSKFKNKVNASIRSQLEEMNKKCHSEKKEEGFFGGLF